MLFVFYKFEICRYRDQVESEMLEVENAIKLKLEYFVIGPHNFEVNLTSLFQA